MNILSFILFYGIFVATIIVSYKSIRQPAFLQRWQFDSDKLFVYKRYETLLTGGFVHAQWMPLIFGLLTLYFFGTGYAVQAGMPAFFFVYFACMAGSHYLTAWARGRHDYVVQQGCFNAAIGVLFAFIVLQPRATLHLFFIPMPAYIMGLLLIAGPLIYFYRQRHIGIYDGPLMAGLIGMVCSSLIHFRAFLLEPLLNGLLIGLAAAGLLWMYGKWSLPGARRTGNARARVIRMHKRSYTKDDQANLDRKAMQEEVDRILEKIHQKGINSLSKEEKASLDRFTKQ